MQINCDARIVHANSLASAWDTWADSLEIPIFIKIRKVLLCMENILVYFIQAELSGLNWFVYFYPPFACDEGVQGTLKSSPWVSDADTPSRTLLNPFFYFNWESSSSLYTGSTGTIVMFWMHLNKKKKHSYYLYIFLLLLIPTWELLWDDLGKNFSDPGSLWSALRCDFSLLSYCQEENSFICFLEILPEVWSSHDILFFFF